MQLDPITTPLIVGIAGKIFISAANSMPAPPSDGGYWQRWFHDFIQDLASNSSKIGITRPIATEETTVKVTEATETHLNSKTSS